jgi:hypothetical protein
MEEQMDEPSTSDLIEVLGDDVYRCHGELLVSIDEGTIDPDGGVYADYEYHARRLVRAIFAFIEAVTFSVKVHAAQYCLEHGRDISPPERFYSVDVEYTLSDKGEVTERAAHIRLADNIRFAFALQEKALGLATKFDASIKWWSCLKASIKVRDRLTHAKLPRDINVSGDEIVAALEAYEGFKQQVTYYADARPPIGDAPTQLEVE